jgi:hypothetical protein
VPDGNVSKEVFELSRRAQALEISVAFLSVDPIREVKEGLPWSQFGHNEPPFVGQPLRHANDHVLSQAVDALMEYFE